MGIYRILPCTCHIGAALRSRWSVHYHLAALLFACLWAAPVPADERHVIGVLALRPKPQTLAAYAPLADYLTQRIAGHRFAILPLDRDEMRQAAQAKRFDFAIVNPDLYVELELRHGALRLATQLSGKVGEGRTQFAGLIFTQARRSDLRTLADLKGKRIAAVAPDAFGGFLIQGAALLEAGVDPYADINTTYLGLPQDRIVQAVLNGVADAGFVRSGLLEELAAEGKIRLADFKPLGAHPSALPYWHSTPLYPEWAFAAMGGVSPALAKRVAIALLSLPDDHPSLTAGRYAGWDVPANYEPVHEVLKRMRAPPYDAPVKLELEAVLRQYALHIIAILSLLLGVIGTFAWRNARLHRELVREQAELRLSDAVFTNALEGLVVTAPDGTILTVNPAFTQITGYRREEVIGQNPRLLKSGRHDAAFYTALWRELLANGHWRGEIWNRRKDGSIYPQILNIACVKDAAGRITQYVGSFTDISDLKAAEENLRQLAHYDALTGLPNRRLLIDRMELAMKQTLRRERLLAVCFLDLDGFKAVNDTMGHATGDRLLIEVAQRLQSNLRAGDTVARLGGDEFVLLLPDLATVEELTHTLTRVLDALSRPYANIGSEPRIGGSIGVTLYPLDDVSADGLLRHADYAMYQAKQLGRGRFVLFDPKETKMMVD